MVDPKKHSVELHGGDPALHALESGDCGVPSPIVDEVVVVVSAAAAAAAAVVVAAVVVVLVVVI